MINRTAIITSYCPNINAYQSGTCTSVFVAGFGNVYVHGHLQEFFQRGGGVTACIDRNRPWILRLGMTLAAAKDVTHVHVFHLLYGLSSSATLATANTTTGSWYGTSYGTSTLALAREFARVFGFSLGNLSKFVSLDRLHCLRMDLQFLANSDIKNVKFLLFMSAP